MAIFPPYFFTKSAPTTWFSEDSPLNLLERVKPDILVKGGDYKLNQVVGADLVKKYGGKIATVELQEGWSGASLVERIQNSSLNFWI